MQTTGIFTTHHYRIPVVLYGEPIHIMPFGDVHRSARLHARREWGEFLTNVRNTKNAYLLGMGDYLDLASTSERRLLGSKDLHESTVGSLEDMYRKETVDMADELSFAKGRFIGLIEGNHYGEFQNGTTTTQKMAELLDCRYLGVSSFIRLSLCDHKRKDSRSIDIWAHHGQGGSRLIGGSLNRVQQMIEAAEADVYLMGHDHKESVGMTSRLCLKGNCKSSLTVSHRKVVVARTGSFLKGYEPNAVSYIADRAAGPVDLGAVTIVLTPRRASKTRSFEIDINAVV